METLHLKRTLSLTTVVFYGIGTIIGAGIYALIGKIAGVAGVYTPFAFLLAALIALFTGISYAELSSRYPRSGGVAIYMYEAWGNKHIANIFGILLILTGIVSSATLANGFVGYFQVFFPISNIIIITSLILVLGVISSWGIKESALVISAITLIEIFGLIFVIIVLLLHSKSLHILNLQIPSFDKTIWYSIFVGAFLAFYAFIGFEDMVNIAEEIIEPQKQLPLAIFIAILIPTILYFAISILAVNSISPVKLSESSAPLTLLLSNTGTYSPFIISIISIISIINGILVQIIMSARVLYGMGKELNAPKILAYVHQRTQTPIIATILVTLIILVFALWLPIVTLAKITSAVILAIFTAVNISLIRVKIKIPYQENAKHYLMIFPVIGALLCVGLLIIQELRF